MICCKYYKKIIICWNISLVIALLADIFIAYIRLKPFSTFLRKFYLGDLANFTDSTIVFLLIAALIIQWFDQLLHCRDGSDCCLSWGVSSLTTVPDGIYFRLFLILPIFPDLFCGNKFMSVSFIEALLLSWEIVLGSFLKMSSRYNV